MKLFSSVVTAMALLLIHISAHSFELRESSDEELTQAQIFCGSSGLLTRTLTGGDLAKAIHSLKQTDSIAMRFLLLFGERRNYFIGPPPPINLTTTDRIELCGIALPVAVNGTAIEPTASNRPDIFVPDPPDGPALGMDVVTVSGESRLTLQNLLIDAYFWGGHCAVLAIKQNGQVHLIQSSIIRGVITEDIYGIYSVIYMGPHGKGQPSLTVEGSSSVLTGNQLKVIDARDSKITIHGGVITNSDFLGLYIVGSLLTLNGTQLINTISQQFYLDRVYTMTNSGEQNCLELGNTKNLIALDCDGSRRIVVLTDPNTKRVTVELSETKILIARRSEILMNEAVLTGVCRSNELFLFEDVTIDPQSRDNLFFDVDNNIAQPPSDLINIASGQEDISLSDLFNSSGRFTVCKKEGAVMFITTTGAVMPSPTILPSQTPEPDADPDSEQASDRAGLIAGTIVASVSVVVAAAVAVSVPILVYLYRKKHPNQALQKTGDIPLSSIPGGD